MTTSISASTLVNCDASGEHQSGCSWRKPAGAGPCQWWASSSSSSRARITRALVLLGVVVAEHVEHAVDDEQGQLVVERAGVRRAPGGRRPPGRSRRRRAASACRRGRAARGRGRGSAPVATARRRPARRRSGRRARRSGPVLPMYRSLSSVISASVTKISDSSAQAAHAFGGSTSSGQRLPAGEVDWRPRPARRRRTPRGRPAPPYLAAGVPMSAVCAAVTPRRPSARGRPVAPAPSRRVGRRPARRRRRCRRRSGGGRRRRRRGGRSRARRCR